MKRSTARCLRDPIGLAVALTALVAVSCTEPRGLLTGVSPVPPDVQQACALATAKCAHCHPIDRVVVSRGIGEQRWKMYVEQMRLKPSSGISESEGQVIFSCLRFVEQTCAECKQGRS